VKEHLEDDRIVMVELFRFMFNNGTTVLQIAMWVFAPCSDSIDSLLWN